MSSPNDSQEALLLPHAYTAKAELPRPELEAESIEPSVFPAVDLLERNLALIKAMGLLASTTGKHGLKHAASSAIHRPALEERYKDKTDEVVSGARKKIGPYTDESRELFDQAFGVGQMTGSIDPLTLDDVYPEVAEDKADRSYPDFRDHFNGARNAKAREKYKAKLADQLKTLQ